MRCHWLACTNQAMLHELKTPLAAHFVLNSRRLRAFEHCSLSIEVVLMSFAVTFARALESIVFGGMYQRCKTSAVKPLL